MAEQSLPVGEEGLLMFGVCVVEGGEKDKDVLQCVASRFSNGSPRWVSRPVSMLSKTLAMS